jgi:hypothetical protein
VALPFARGEAFPEDKAAGEPCRNLRADFRCGIHSDLLTLGWRGCVSFDCFGAGQQLTRTFEVTRAGGGGSGVPLNAVFVVARQLHEIGYLLSDPACAESSYAVAAAALLDEVLAQVVGPPEEVVAADLEGLRARAGALFAGVAAERGGADHRGALLMAADLREEDFTDANLLGADLRDADLRGANLARALFVSQPQLNSARGDVRTTLPDRLTAPAQWLTNANQSG